MRIAVPFSRADGPATGGRARARVQLIYWWRFGRLAQLDVPTRFTELVQLRKLHDRDPRLPLMADKVGVKTHVAQMLGGDWIVPTLWSGISLPETPEWPMPFAVKSRHGSNQSAFVRDDNADWPAIRVRANRWVGRGYGDWLDEWGYRDIPRGLLIEPFVGADGVLPVDYKFYVFGGRVAFVQVHLDRERDHRWIVHDRAWRTMREGAAAPKPTRLAEMIEAAEALGAGYDFVRVDFYQIGQQPMFGEMSFYPGSGLDPFDPPMLDMVMGRLWLEARGDGYWRRPLTAIAGLPAKAPA